MSLPAVSVFIGTAVASNNLTLDHATKGKLDTGGTLGDALGYTLSDITVSVRDHAGISINRGATRNKGPYFRSQAGKCTFTLDNRDGDFDPLNLSGTWVSAGVSQLRPGLVVVVTYTLDSVAGGCPLFIGTVQSWDVKYPRSGSDSVAVVTCVDAIGEFAASDLPASPSQGSGENAGNRINRILDNAGWSSQWRDIDDDGAETLQPTEMAQPAWTEMLLTADSANGYLFADCSGYLVYRTKSRFPRTPVALFATGGVPVDSVEVGSDADQIYNMVKLARKGGVVQGVRDETSEALYNTRSYSRSDLLVSTNDLVSISAGHILSQFKDLQQRVEAVKVTAAQDTTSAHWQTILSLDLLDRVSTTFDTTDSRTVTIEGLVRGINITIKPFVWSWTFATAQAPEALGTFVLDHAQLGVLDTGTLAAF